MWYSIFVAKRLWPPATVLAQLFSYGDSDRRGAVAIGASLVSFSVSGALVLANFFGPPPCFWWSPAPRYRHSVSIHLFQFSVKVRHALFVDSLFYVCTDKSGLWTVKCILYSLQPRSLTCPTATIIGSTLTKSRLQNRDWIVWAISFSATGRGPFSSNWCDSFAELQHVDDSFPYLNLHFRFSIVCVNASSFLCNLVAHFAFNYGLHGVAIVGVVRAIIFCLRFVQKVRALFVRWNRYLRTFDFSVVSDRTYFVVHRSFEACCSCYWMQRRW